MGNDTPPARQADEWPDLWSWPGSRQIKCELWSGGYGVDCCPVSAARAAVVALRDGPVLPHVPLEAIRRECGDAVLFDALGIIGLLERDDRCRSWRWWPHKQILAMGDPDTPEAIEALVDRARALEDVVLRITIHTEEEHGEDEEYDEEYDGPITSTASVLRLSYATTVGDGPTSYEVDLNPYLFWPGRTLRLS